MNKDYILMCKKATEIQALWDPKPGDCLYKEYSDMDKEWVKCNTPNTEDPNGFYCHVNDSINMNIGPLAKHYKKRGLWLPRQEDLQGILSIFLNKELNALDFINLLSTWKKPSREWSEYYFLLDLNLFWIICTMEICFKKTWNHETKQWQPIEVKS
jgi:hypothetical protein